MLHGLPDDIVSDRYPKLAPTFWSELLSIYHVKARMSSSNHSQTNGLSKLMNRIVENYIRCYCALNPKSWDKILAAAELAYKSAHTEDLGILLFEVDMGWKRKAPIEILRISESTNEPANECKMRMGEGCKIHPRNG